MHLRGSRRVIERNAPKRRRLQLTLPRSLLGVGSRLAIDRVTQAGVQSQNESEHNDNNGSFTDHQQSPLNLGAQVPECIDVGEDINFKKEKTGTDALCNSFLTLSRAAGDKQCNELLSTLRNNCDSVPSFLEKFKTVQDLKMSRRIELADTLSKQGFIEHKRRSTSGIAYKMYCRDPVYIIREQLQLTRSCEVVTKPIDSEEYSHPLNSGIGRVVVPMVEDYVKRNELNDVRWRTTESDGEASCVGCLQFFSDKSQTSLSAGAFKFYPIHVTLLNFTEGARRSHICEGRTLFAYLPVTFCGCDCSTDAGIDLCKCRAKEKRVKRVDFLEALHDSINFSVEPLARTALSGMPSVTLDGIHLRMHLVVSSYLCDTPEAEDLLAVKRGTQCQSPCHVCLVRKEDLPFSCVGTGRSLKDTSIMVSRLNVRSPGIEEEFQSKSMLSIPPILSQFPCMSLHPSVDIYTLFRYEPMHNLSLGISKLLKECCVYMLKDTERSSPAMCTMAGLPRSFNTIRKEILHCLNKLLRNVQRSSSGYGLHVDFSKGETAGRLSGFFTETGVVGMLEAQNFDTLDMVAPFLGAVVDTCCGTEEKAPVTNTYVAYSELLDFIYRRRTYPSWNEAELGVLITMIGSFKTIARDTFGKYQASNMGTSKWHALEHVVDNLRDLGGIQYMHGGLYEQSHKNFKEDYKLTSKRVHSAMTETLKRQEERALLQHDQTLRPVRHNRRKIAVVKEDGASLVKTGPTTTLNCVERTVRHINGERGRMCVASNIPKGHLNVALNLIDCIGKDGTGSFIRMMYTQLGRNGIPEIEARNCSVQIIASAYVPGIYPPTLDDAHVSTSVYVRKSNMRQIQRIVAKEAFYGKESRHDAIMVQSDETYDEFPQEQFVPVWFGKALAFVRTPKERNGGTGYGIVLEGETSRDNDTLQREFCFLQYFEVLGREKLCVDNIDSALKCIRLRWHRTQGNNAYSSAKEFGLVPVESILGKVHLVRGDFALPIVGKDVQKKIGQSLQ